MSELLTALYKGDHQTVEALLAEGPELNLYEAAAVGQGERLATLLAEQPDLLNAFAPDGFTALGLAAFFGHETTAKQLIEAGADVNLAANNFMQVTPLHSAVAKKHLAIAQALLQHGAQVNAKQQGGWTPLHGAVFTDDLPMLQLLLTNGADPDVTSDEGLTPLALAEQRGCLAVANRLR